MENLTSFDIKEDIIHEVLMQETYKEHCNSIFDLFCTSRLIKNEPNLLYEVQKEIAKRILYYQDKKIEGDKNGNEIEKVMASRLITILKRIMDGVAWRLLDFDRVLFQLMVEHHQTGHLDKTILGDLEQSKLISEQSGSIALINDLTTVLRYGDLTIVKDTEFSILETKYGRGSSRSGRAKNQRKNLENLKDFIKTGTRFVEGREEFIFRADTPVNGYFFEVERTLNEARKNGYSRTQLGSCFLVEAISPTNQENFSKKIFNPNSPTLITINNLTGFVKGGGSVAPYSIFPFSNQNCFDLLTGNLLFYVTFDLSILVRQYQMVGIIFEFPNPSYIERQQYLTASHYEKKKLMSIYDYHLTQNGINMTITPLHLAKLIHDLLTENTIIQADKQILKKLGMLGITFGNPTRYYIGYTKENNLWV